MSSILSKTKPGIALITGASSGIGRAAAIALNQAGWTTVVCARRKDALEETVSMMEEEGQKRTKVVVADLGVEEDVVGVFEVIKKEFGRLDLVFNNAGMSSRKVPIEEITSKEFKQLMDVNVTACFICCQEAVKIMKAQEPMGGRIINNGSISAYVPRPFSAPYTMSKHAILGLTKSVSLDGRKWNIVCSQLDIGNAESAIGASKTGGILQANGELIAEPTMDCGYAGEAIAYMASLPLSVNNLYHTLMANAMPYVGRG